jgi:hypothetical protein
LDNIINGDNVKDKRDSDLRVPRDKVQGRCHSEAHPFTLFDELVVFERKFNMIVGHSYTGGDTLHI